jgi:hypothetical protein
MEKEMRQLGLRPTMKRMSVVASAEKNNNSSNDKAQAVELFSSIDDDKSMQINGSGPIVYCEMLEKSTDSSSSYPSRPNTPLQVSAVPIAEPTKLKLRRKFSLDYKRSILPRAIHATSFMKSSLNGRRHSLMVIDEKKLNNKKRQALLNASIIREAESIENCSDMRSDSSIMGVSYYEPSLHSSTRTHSKVESISNSSSSASRAPSLGKRSATSSLPKLISVVKSPRPRSVEQKETNTPSKRHVSFRKLTDQNGSETRNAGFERYKFNPDYYLPDGSLRRKFSLPKLCESLEAVKHCGYLRRNSMDSSYEPIDLNSLFKQYNNHNNSNQSELGFYE